MPHSVPRWYHGNVSRIEAETALRLQPPGSYLIRNCESARKDYSLSLKYVHLLDHFCSNFFGSLQPKMDQTLVPLCKAGHADLHTSIHISNICCLLKP